MPIYEYRCDRCEKQFEKLVFDEPRIECPECGSTEVTKVPSVFGMSGVDKPFAGQSSCGSCSKSSCDSCG